MALRQKTFQNFLPLKDVTHSKLKMIPQRALRKSLFLFGSQTVIKSRPFLGECNYMLIGTLLNDPKLFTEAAESPDYERWKTAMMQEIASMDKHSSWKLVTRPPDYNVTGCKYIFKVNRKQQSDGTVCARLEVWLFAKECFQNEGVAY